MSADPKVLRETMIRANLAVLERFNNLFARNQRESVETLRTWAEFFVNRNFTVAQVQFAISEIAKKNITFMPSAMEISAVLSPSLIPLDYRAEQIVNEILEGIKDCAAGRKTNFFDDFAEDTKATASLLGGYSVIKEMNLANDYSRTRAIKAAISTLKLIEANNRNKKLRDQGIECTVTPLVESDIPKIHLVKENEPEEEPLSPEEVQKMVKELNQSIS